VPLSLRTGVLAGLRIDFWATMITFIEVSALVAAVELIVTIFKQRAPGMSLNRMPLFVWAILVMSFMIVFAMPPLMIGSVMLALDRTVGTLLLQPGDGRRPAPLAAPVLVLRPPRGLHHLHPALGMVSTIIVAFARRPLFGYTALVLSIVAIGLHRVRPVGAPHVRDRPAGARHELLHGASMMIAIPSGVQIFCWIATLWGRPPDLKTPLLFVLGFIVIFVIGGLTGVMVASVPFDKQVHDTYFVVAHFHYVLIGGAGVPALRRRVYYWFPKLTGRMLSSGSGAGTSGSCSSGST
jgi:cytochrome c oxidase subunit I+III